MEKLFEFGVNGFALAKHEDKLRDLLVEWIEEKNGLDVDISFFIINELGMINIDCFKLNDSEADKAKQLTEDLLKNLHIDYVLN